MISLLITSFSLLLTIFSGYAQDCQEHARDYHCELKNCKIEGFFETLNLCRKEFIIQGAHAFATVDGKMYTVVSFTYWSKPTANVTDVPTELPTTEHPTERPTRNPTTEHPTERPTRNPTTEHPTERPTRNPATEHPTERPTRNPTRKMYTMLGNQDDHEAVDEGNTVLYGTKGGFFVHNLEE